MARVRIEIDLTNERVKHVWYSYDEDDLTKVSGSVFSMKVFLHIVLIVNIKDTSLKSVISNL